MIQTERDNRKKRIKTMKKAQKWGEHRVIFEKEHANGASRASLSTTPYHTCVLRARIRKNHKHRTILSEKTLRIGKNTKKCENEKKRRKSRKIDRPKLQKPIENNLN